MDRPRKFIAVDTYAAVQVGDLEKETKCKRLVKPKFTRDFPRAVVREGADELTLHAHEDGAVRSFTPRVWETKDGGHRSWMRTGTPSARPEWGGPCTVNTRSCTIK